MPRVFGQGGGEPVPVLKIGLNDPHTKSVVMSTTEFSADELAPVQPPPQPAEKSKRKKRVRRNLKQK